MSDPYISIAAAASDIALRRRIASCIAQEHPDVPDPEALAYQDRYHYAAQPGWGLSWASAEAAGRSDIGSQPDIISDAMILAAVQHG